MEEVCHLASGEEARRHRSENLALAEEVEVVGAEAETIGAIEAEVEGGGKGPVYQLPYVTF